MAILSLNPPAAVHGSSSRHVFVPVLIYHHVKWLKPSDDAIERGLTVLPSQFGQELAYLARNGYHLVSTRQIALYLRGGHSLPRRPVALSFDDGYSDVYLNVYRVLRSRHMTATFFIVPGFLGTSRYLTWSQVRTMSQNGMDIEAHSMTHPDLRAISPAQRWSEIVDSRQLLEARLQTSVRVFAYPYGGFNNSIVDQVR